MTRIAGEWLTAPELQTLMAALAGENFQVLVVGGCVRNALMGVPVEDVDLCTDARPETVSHIAQQAGFSAHPTGIDHGTMTVSANGEAYEITTFRKDVATDGRRAVVAFADTVEDDARRRDLTINALYAQADGRVIDPLGGLSDIYARRVRFIEDPAQRIQEDFLRILRFFRFFAHYGDPAQGLDPEGLAACAAGVDGLAKLSKERIGAEMIKLLSAPDPAPAIAAMEASGCLAQVLPGATGKALAALVHLEKGSAPDPIRRLAALGGSNPRDPLRLSRAQARGHDAIRSLALDTETGVAELAYRLGAKRGHDALLVRHALLSQPLPSSFETDIAKGAAAEFPIRAADLPDLEGPDLGAALKKLEAAWIASGFSLTKAELLG